MRSKGRIGLIMSVLCITWFIISYKSMLRRVFTARNVPGFFDEQMTTQTVYKCGLSKECSPSHFPFHLRTGAANVIGPRICFDGKIVMSGVNNNIGPGLNIAVVNGTIGKVEKAEYFNMYSGNPAELLKFLNEIKPDTIVLVASYDDPGNKMTEDIREIFSKFGSSHVSSVQFRDSWVFAGASGIVEKSPFEKLVKNDKASNTYDGWPELAETGGCFPKKL